MHTFAYVFQNGCPSPACKKILNGCSKNTYTLPFYDVINPLPSHLGSIITCTNSSKYQKCSCKCEYDNHLGYCIPMTGQDFCGKKIIHLCPTGCKYNFTQNKCIPILNIYLCEIDKKIYPPRCPIGCTLNDNMCTGLGCNINIQYECDALCPSRKCCTGICDPGEHNDIMNICEQTIRAKCPDGYIFDVNVSFCSRFNRNNLCKISNNILEYPSRLSNEIGIIQCKLIHDINCSDIHFIIRECPSGCKLDTFANKCISSNKDLLCGSNLLSCPVNKIYNNQCIFNENIPSVCSNNQILFNIVGVTSNYSMCGPKWFYG